MSTVLLRNFSALVLSGLIGMPAAQAVQDLDLWLPASYRDLMPQLRKAALAVEETQECEKVMQAGLYEASRKSEVPKFRLLCRDSDRHSYAVLVDSQTLDMTFPGRKVTVKGFSPKMIAATWRNCQDQLQRKTQYMNEMVLLSEGMPTPDTSESGVVKMFVDFDAQSIQRQPLHYRATCVASHDKPATLTIKGRSKP